MKTVNGREFYIRLRTSLFLFFSFKNSSSWVLLNLAAYYWRIKGNALEAVECLRRALYFSPRLGSLFVFLYCLVYFSRGLYWSNLVFSKVQKYGVLELDLVIQQWWWLLKTASFIICQSGIWRWNMGLLIQLDCTVHEINHYWLDKTQQSCSNYELSFVFSREHKDRALMSLAAVLHHSKHNLDSVVLLHSAIDVNNEQSVYHFLLGNIYSVSKHLSVTYVQKCT